MSENVPVVLEFDSVDNASTDVEGLSNSLNEYSDSAENAGESSSKAAQTSTMAWTEFYSAYSTVLQVVEKGKEIWDETVGVTVQLANEVRGFRDVTGQSAEESSRLVQVLDDYKINVSAAEMATKKFSKDGLQFNIDTLAQLSDQYLALNSDVEKTNFLYEKFGKSGDNFAEIMLQGSEAILAANDAISEQLILGDKQLRQAREYEKQLDNTSDAMMGLKVSIGNGLLPVANDLLQVIQAQIDEGFEWQDAIAPLALIENVKKLSEAQKDNVTAMMEADTARWNGLASLYATNEAIDDVTISTEDMSKANESFLSLLGSMQSTYESHDSKIKSLTDERIKLEEEKQGLISQGYTEESEKVQEINDKIQANIDKTTEEADNFDLQNKKIMLGYLERQLTADGTLDDKELQWLLDKGVAWGVYSQTVVDETRRAMDEANALIEGLVTEKTFTLSLNTIYSTYGDSAMVVGGPRAEGGAVSGGMMYPVNEKGMPELLNMGGRQMLMMPEGANGSVTPLKPAEISGAGGSVNNFNFYLDSATPDPERVAYQIAPAVERVLRSKKLI